MQQQPIPTHTSLPPCSRPSRTNPADGPPKKAPVLDGREPPTASQRLRDDIEEVSEKHHEAQERCEQEVVKLSLDNLMTFPSVITDLTRTTPLNRVFMTASPSNGGVSRAGSRLGA
jgi:hypothetical protein